MSQNGFMSGSNGESFLSSLERMAQNNAIKITIEPPKYKAERDSSGVMHDKPANTSLNDDQVSKLRDLTGGGMNKQVGTTLLDQIAALMAGSSSGRGLTSTDMLGSAKMQNPTLQQLLKTASPTGNNAGFLGPAQAKPQGMPQQAPQGMPQQAPQGMPQQGKPQLPPQLMQMLAQAQPRAAGGPVAPGNPYLVGEKGAELFVPEQPGTVLPNSGPQGAPQGGSAGGMGGLDALITQVIQLMKEKGIPLMTPNGQISPAALQFFMQMLTGKTSQQSPQMDPMAAQMGGGQPPAGNAGINPIMAQMMSGAGGTNNAPAVGAKPLGTGGPAPEITGATPTGPQSIADLLKALGA